MWEGRGVGAPKDGCRKEHRARRGTVGDGNTLEAGEAMYFQKRGENLDNCTQESKESNKSSLGNGEKLPEREPSPKKKKGRGGSRQGGTAFLPETKRPARQNSPM